MTKELSRADRARLALFDHGTRKGATSNSVIRAMEKDGFTRDEILAAVEKMQGPK